MRSPGTPDIDWGRRVRGRSTLGRFMAKIEHRTDTGCWLWTATIRADGYGDFTIWHRHNMAHRRMFELYYGPLADDVQIDHICRVRHCVNPEHLEAVTPRVNTVRGIGITAKHAAATHCKRGHPFSGENLYTTPSGGRTCRTCQRARDKAYNEKHRSKGATS